MTIVEEDGLDIASSGKLAIQKDGVVKITGGGQLELDGQIEFAGGGSGDTDPVLRIDGTLNIPQSGGDGDVVGTGAGVIEPSAEMGDCCNGEEDILVLGKEHEIVGKVTIKIALRIAGTVHADRAGAMVLTDNPKMGTGFWSVSTSSSAILRVDAPVMVLPCAELQVTDGTLDVNAPLIVCGGYGQSDSIVDVAAGNVVELGDCVTTPIGAPGLCVCPAEEP